jgi:uncharacterized protein YacL
LSGVGLNLIRVVFILIMPADTLYLQAQIFFVIVALILMVCGFSYKILMNNEFFLYYKNKGSQQVTEDIDIDENPDEEHRKLLMQRN